MTDAASARDKRWIALILLSVAQFVVILDASIVNVALPTIGKALDFAPSATRRLGSGARSPAPAAPLASCSAAC